MKDKGFEPGRQPVDWDALAAELKDKRCLQCGDPATSRCVGIPAHGAFGLVMYLCQPCVDSFMAWIASGCMGEYDARRNRQRCVN